MIALHELLGAGHPDHTPVCQDGARVITFKAFRALTLEFAAHFRTRSEHRFALCSDDPYLFSCALFALFVANKEPVIPASAAPGYLADLSSTYDAVLTDIELSALAEIRTSDHLERLADPTQNVRRESMDPAEQPAPNARADHAIHKFAPLTLFTSGSSGTPKAVHKTLAEFNAEVHTLEAQWGAQIGSSTVLASVPHHHIYGMLFRVFWPLAAGRAFGRSTCVDPQQLKARLAEVGPAVVVSMPAHLARWPELPGFAALDPHPLAFFSSGGPLAPETARAFVETFSEAPLEIYGSTETGGIAWRSQRTTLAWTPMPGIQVRRDERGALAVQSPHLPHADWHKTDDAVSIDEHGRFSLQGRLDRVVKLDGKRIALAEIEMQLSRHPFVAAAAATLLDGASRKRIAVVVVLNAEGERALCDTSHAQMSRTLRRDLATYFDTIALPRYWRFRRALPYDGRGKLPAAQVASEFNARAEGFEMLSEVVASDAIHYELHVPRSLVHFRGHFDGFPILPGVVQVDWAVRLASANISELRAVESIEHLKFTAPVSPGTTMRLTLSHEIERRRVQFKYRVGEHTCASGAIVYGEPA